MVKQQVIKKIANPFNILFINISDSIINIGSIDNFKTYLTYKPKYRM